MKTASHSLSGCLLPAVIAAALCPLILAGVGSTLIVSLFGLLLCAAGFSRRSAQIDLRIFRPYLLYCLVGMLSCVNVYRNISAGSYVSRQLLFPALYLLIAALDHRQHAFLKQLCLLCAGGAAAVSTGRFVLDALLYGRAGRLGGVLGNPNALGIFLVVSWFALMHCISEEEERFGRLSSFLPYLEPVLLVPLALTLSMGSFLAMAAGILVALIRKKRQSSLREAFRYGCRILAKVSLAVGTGVLLYLSAARTGAPWCCLLLLLYALAMTLCWKKLGLFFDRYPKAAALAAVGGFLVTAVIILSRPSSPETFLERLEMMRNGAGYLLRNPVLGIGPDQWRIWNRFDADKYFNTWYIHNSLIHVGAELGMTALILLLFASVRIFRKDLKPWSKAGFTAFFVHTLLDATFFHTGIMTLTVITLGEPRLRGKTLGNRTVKLLFGAFALVFLCNLYYCIRIG